MLQTVYVKPKEGGRVRQPERGSRVMPAEGALVQRNGYYTRLILAGDVVVTEPPKAPPEAAPPVAENASAEPAQVPKAAPTPPSTPPSPVSNARG